MDIDGRLEIIKLYAENSVKAGDGMVTLSALEYCLKKLEAAQRRINELEADPIGVMQWPALRDDLTAKLYTAEERIREIEADLGKIQEKIAVSATTNGAPLNKAIMIAAEAHAGQVDKGGQPYIFHPLRLMMQMDNDEERIVAVLHDVIEDDRSGRWTLAALQSDLFATLPAAPLARIMSALDALTHRRGEEYASYIARVQKNALATKIKLSDLRDNMDLSRIPVEKQTEKDQQRWVKYAKALETLLDRE